MNAVQRQALFQNTARQVGGAAKHIQERHIANCTKADPAYGAGVAQAIARLAQRTSSDDRQSIDNAGSMENAESAGELG
jgi:catalase